MKRRVILICAAPTKEKLLILIHEFYRSKHYIITEDNKVTLSFENDIEKDTNIDINHVFDAFYRDDSRHCEGVGLGLYVVKCLTEKLNHQVEAEVSSDVFKVRITLGV